MKGGGGMALPRCKRCHRVLKDPESVSSGFGPSCRRKLFGAKKKPRQQKNIKVSSPGRLPKHGPDTMSLDEWLARLEGGGCGTDNEDALQKEKEPTAKP